MGCKILKIGVFFDGTGNTKGPDSSKGQMSNVAKLSELYRDEEFKNEKGKEITSFMRYTNGVGTYDSDIIDFFNPIDRKYDKGGGGGGAKRIYKMIDEVVEILNTNLYDLSEPSGYARREIDVFGFSRGAAMARDFVNTFFEDIGTKDNYIDIKFNFIGIYDTVGSFGKPGNSIDMKPKKEYLKYVDEDYLPNGMDLKDEDFGIQDPQKGRDIEVLLGIARGERELKEQISYYEARGWRISFKSYNPSNGHNRSGSMFSHSEMYKVTGVIDEWELFDKYNFNLRTQSAKKIVHMTAHDEVRKNFPLTNIKASGGAEYSYIGVHSDIGGGYKPESSEEFIYDVFAYNKDEATKKAQEIADGLNVKIKESLKDYTWYVDDVDALGVVDLFEDRKHLKKYKVTLAKEVNNELSLVTLHLMHEEAVAAKVPFKKLTETLPSYLQEYYEFAKKSKKRAYEFAELDDDGASLKDALSHHSARDPAKKFDHKTPDVSTYDGVVHDEPESGNDARYVNPFGEVVDGRKKKASHLTLYVQREIFDNQPLEAVLPAEA